MATFDELLDFSRPTEATYTGADGLIHTAAANEPRFTHDPVTGEPQGLLIEEQRTNLLLWSDEFWRGAWGTQQDAQLGQYDDPRGLCKTLVYTTGDGNYSAVRQYPATTEDDGKIYTFSIYLRLLPGAQSARPLRLGESRNPTSGRRWYITLDNATGAVADTTNIVSHTHKDLGDDYHFYSITVLNDENSSARVDMTIAAQSGVTERLDIVAMGGAQFEEGATASSRIRTEDAQVTRAADEVSRELGAEFNASEGTLWVDFVYPAAPGFGVKVAAHDLSFKQRLYIALDSDGAVLFNSRNEDAGHGGSSIDLASGLSEGDMVRAAISYDVNGQFVRAVANGGDVSSRSMTPPLVSHISLGSQGNATGNGLLPSDVHEILHANYIPRALSESELISLTTPEAN